MLLELIKPMRYENVYRFSSNRVHTQKSMNYLNSNNDGGSALSDARQAL